MRRPLVRTLLLAGVLLLAGGCVTPQLQWPAITDVRTDVYVQGRWVWRELLADNVEAEKAFYREVFGWEYESRGSGGGAYTLVRANGQPIAGIVHMAKPEGAVRSARWLPLMSVPDATVAADLAIAGGGKVLVPPKKFKGRGTTAVLADPEGALFGVLRPENGEQPDEFPLVNAWLWTELWAKDADKMATFYMPIGSYQASRQAGPGERQEVHLAAKGFPRAGILEIERKDLPSAWLPYIRVADVQKAVAAIEQAGGKIVVAPSPDIRKGKVAVFLDPQGAAAAVAEWKDEDGEEGKP